MGLQPVITSTSVALLKTLNEGRVAYRNPFNAMTVSKSSTRRPYTVTAPDPIHILGVGNLGLMFAHSLAREAGEHRPKITLLVHRQEFLEKWSGSIERFEGHPNNANSVIRQGFEVELVASQSGSQDCTLIQNLILATKTTSTVDALLSVKNRLDQYSTVIFAQNGMGTIEEVNKKVFMDPSRRPKYWTSVVSHGVYGYGPYRWVHAGLGSIAIGMAQPSHGEISRYLVDRVLESEQLAAREVDAVEIKHLQLQKLVVNAMINPLTVVFDCQNGELFGIPEIRSLMRILLTEASQVLLALPELQADPEIRSRYSVEVLEDLVLDVAVKTGKNTSSMLQDVRAGKPTEIDYINDYLVKRGVELGIRCRHNERLVEMVRDGQRINVQDIGRAFPC